jgi:hypothetical protein
METDNALPFDFVVPLSPFERILLDGIQTTYSSLLDEAAEIWLDGPIILEKHGKHAQAGEGDGQQFTVDRDSQNYVKQLHSDDNDDLNTGTPHT